MVKWLVGTFRRYFGGQQAQVYRPAVSSDTTGPIMVYGCVGR